MLFDISHSTNYAYSDEVFFEPHYLRFKPRSSPHLRVEEFNIEVFPEPVGIYEQADAESNYHSLCWFDGKHDQMTINTRSVVRVKEFNPLDFLIHPPEYLQLPYKYDKRTEQLLAPSIETEVIQESLLEYFNSVLKETNNQSIDFLIELTRYIHNDFSLQSRETGSPRSADETFNIKTGSCRDLAWMQIQMLRELGVAARFVSGYFYIDSEDPVFELHAWVEAYIPGAGWIGLDPSHGIITTAFHIPVVSSAYFKNTMPVSGTIRGKADSELKSELRISITS